MNVVLIVLTYVSVLFASGGGQLCNEDESISCFQPMLNVYKAIVQSLQTGDIQLGGVADTCPDYFRYLKCNNPNCLPPFFQDVDQILIQTLEYVCELAAEDIQRYRYCWENEYINTDMIACGDRATEIVSANRNPCRFYEEFEPCLDDVTRAHCGIQQADLLRGYLFIANSQQKRVMGCDTSPLIGVSVSPQRDIDISLITQDRKVIGPSVQIRCWDCHSGMTRDQHRNCPINGNLTTNLLTSVTCPDACFAKTHRWNKEVIYRGCSSRHYLPERMPRSGCMENQYGVVWCFCDSHLCNTQDMTAFLDPPY